MEYFQRGRRGDGRQRDRSVNKRGTVVTDGWLTVKHPVPGSMELNASVPQKQEHSHLLTATDIQSHTVDKNFFLAEQV